MTPEHRAEKAAQTIWEKDHASQWMGMELISASEGKAVLELTVAQHHCNGHGMCHGGVIFALADSAFAYACNSRNTATVAQHNTISYIASGRLGDRLRADATEISLRGRSGITDVTVTTSCGTVIAEFRGMSRAIKGAVFEET